MGYKAVGDGYQQFGGVSFYVSVSHQENHSWQGYIQWLDSGQKVHFRSELELFSLMKEAVATAQTEEEPIRSWVIA